MVLHQRCISVMNLLWLTAPIAEVQADAGLLCSGNKLNGHSDVTYFFDAQ
jgi:hypothetical protein